MFYISLTIIVIDSLHHNWVFPPFKPSTNIIQYNVIYWNQRINTISPWKNFHQITMNNLHNFPDNMQPFWVEQTCPSLFVFCRLLENGDPLTGIFVIVPSLDLDLPNCMTWSFFFMFTELRWEVIVFFVDIGEIYENFLS